MIAASARLPIPTVLLVVACAAGTAALAANAKPENPGKSTTFKERADAELVKVQNQLRNARARLDNGIVGLSEGAEARTLGERCCGKNIDRATKALTELSRTLEGLEACYGKDEVSFDAETLAAARDDVDLLYGRLNELQLSGNEPQAYESLASVTRAYFGLKKGLAALPDCGKPSKRGK